MGLIAGSDKISGTSAPPNVPPEWSSLPTPSFVASTTGTYDFSVNTFDPDDVTLIYTISSASTPLTSAFTLSTDGILFADGTQSDADINNVIVEVDDGTNPKVTSSAFYIQIVTNSATQDLEFQWDFQSQSLGDVSSSASPPFFLEQQPSPLPNSGTYMTVTTSSPLVTGAEQNYLNTAINKDNGSSHRRTEYAMTFTSADPNRQSIVRLTSDPVAGGPADDQWTATEAQWYGMLVRVDQVVNEGPGGILMQFHSIGVVPSAIPASPLWYVSGNSAGFRIKTERTDYYDNTLVAQSWDIPEMRWPACQGEVHAIIFHVFWDSRKLVDGGQGFMNVYIDDNVTPLVADTGRNVTYNYSEISSVYKGPYLKFGMYATGVRTGTYEQSYDNVVVMGQSGTRQGMLDALNWANRTA